MNDDLLWNKIFGAGLATLFVVVGLRQISDMVFTTKPPAKPGYAIAVQEAATGDQQVADTPPDWGTVLPTADVAAGATTATKCKSCHNFDNGGPNQTGPNLWGVIGRKPGSHPGFAYSSSMTGFGAKVAVWDFQHIYEFVTSPQSYLDGTKMSFVGLKQRQDRINVIAWLRSQSSSPLAIPPADPKAAAPVAAPNAATAPGDAKPAAADAGAATVASQAGAGKPVAAAPATPANDQSANPTGVTPNTGAAAAPTRVTNAPAGGPPK